MIRQIPLGDNIILTAEKTSVTESGIIVPGAAAIHQEQEVLKVGKFVTELEIGDKVILDFRKFTSRKNKKSKVARNPMQPDDIEDTVIGAEEVVEIPVYNLDGVEVIIVSQYDILPWKTPKENIPSKDEIIIPKVKIEKLN